MATAKYLIAFVSHKTNSLIVFSATNGFVSSAFTERKYVAIPFAKIVKENIDLANAILMNL